MIKISLIIPVYNAEIFLSDTLDSIINQSFSDFEVIAIDDGSTDKSLSILEKYAENDKRIKVFTQKNSGVSLTRNKGIELSQGDYIGFIDSDDILQKDFLKILYENAISTDSDIAITGYSTFYKQLPEDLVHNFTDISIDLNNKIQWFSQMCEIGLGVNIWTKIYKKSLLNENDINFSDKMSYDEDMFFSWKCFLAANRICFDNSIRYFYRLSHLAVTMRYHGDLYKKYNDAYKNLLDFSKKNHYYTDYLNSYIRYNYFKKIPVMLVMIARSRESLLIKKNYVREIINDSKLENLEDNLMKFNKGKRFNSIWVKNIKNKNIYLLLISGYLIDYKMKLARRLKK